ncbi:c-type cytochrome [Thiocapsa sp. UBA6158]|uniref:c-type cytochrome n=1 Tax=Thiocapsa sp. UBA6158 TaxID=1947692 RepID=UPI0025EFCF68|nr:c-type cytochrome [Thiocapsa sp. UBA6158]
MSRSAFAIGLSIALSGLVSTALYAQEPASAGTPAETARLEYEQVMTLTPDLENGRRVYLTCAVCHRPEGWGAPDGTYPQIAGQLRTVIIKQLADIRARNRDNPLMYPFSVPRILGGPQNVADVAAYVAQLPMTPENGVGPGMDLPLGKEVYVEHCTKCHGENGEGNEDEHIPAIAGQHYLYLMRQFDAIRMGRRKNSDPKMVKQIDSFTPLQQAAVLDYTSRLRPPESKLAETGWVNPDFPAYVRDPMGVPPMPPMPAGLMEPPAYPSVPPAR